MEGWTRYGEGGRLCALVAPFQRRASIRTPTSTNLPTDRRLDVALSPNPLTPGPRTQDLSELSIHCTLKYTGSPVREVPTLPVISVFIRLFDGTRAKMERQEAD